MEKIILYGAGAIGKKDYLLLNSQGLENVVCAFCDKNADKIQNLCGVDVIAYSEAKQMDIPFVISIAKETEAYLEIKEVLQGDGVEFYSDLKEYEINKLKIDLVKWNRDFCAFHHIEEMDGYFERVEGKVH